jgi:hypothetical protein
LLFFFVLFCSAKSPFSSRVPYTIYASLVLNIWAVTPFSTIDMHRWTFCFILGSQEFVYPIVMYIV